METEDIRKAVLATIAAIAPETDPHQLQPDRPLRAQVELDSMDWLNVIAGLHDRLSIEIPESDYARLTTLDAIVAYVASKAPRQPGGPAQTQASAALPVVHHCINGTAVTLRPIRAEDMPLEAAFVRHLSNETRYDRFMVTVGELSPRKLKYLTDVDQVRHVALVATTERNGQQTIVGVVRYIVDPAGTGCCEFAVAVDDAWHGSGLAGILMQTLIDIGRSRGLRTMEAIVLATNAPMLHFAHQLGFQPQRDPDDRDTVRVVCSL
jgi:acetyltransferase